MKRGRIDTLPRRERVYSLISLVDSSYMSVVMKNFPLLQLITQKKY